MLSLTGILLACVGLWLTYRSGYWCYQGWLMAHHPGYMVPDKSALTSVICKAVAWTFAAIGVGRIKVIGADNARFAGRLLILPNHSHMLDFAVAERALPISYKQVGTLSEVAKGVRAPFGAWGGFIAIDTSDGKANSKAVAERTVNAYARALTFRSRGRLLIFPQGYLVFSGQIPADSTVKGSMRTGAVRGAQLALQVVAALKSGDKESLNIVRQVHGSQADETIAYYRSNPAALDEPLAILPVSIDYHRRHKDSDAVNIFSKMFAGATVVVGEPIPATSLPQDPRQASELVRQKIESLRITA